MGYDKYRFNTIEKALIVDQGAFKRWLGSVSKGSYHCDAESNPPSQYPCVVVWTFRNGYPSEGNSVDYRFVYLSDLTLQH